jgi:hypothetical protein
MKTVTALLVLLLIMVLSGCMIAQNISELTANGKLTTPHEAFISHYSYRVGKEVLPKSVPVEELENEGTRIYWGIGTAGFRKLPNGNWELENDLYQGACRIFYEYNPVTRIVVSWRYEGSDENCVQNPYT